MTVLEEEETAATKSGEDELETQLMIAATKSTAATKSVDSPPVTDEDFEEEMDVGISMSSNTSVTSDSYAATVLELPDDNASYGKYVAEMAATGTVDGPADWSPPAVSPPGVEAEFAPKRMRIGIGSANDPTTCCC